MHNLEIIPFKIKVDIKEKCNDLITDKTILCYRYCHKSKELYYRYEIDGFSNNQDSFNKNQNGYIYEINNIFYFVINKGKEMGKITKFLETHITKIFNDFKKEEWCNLQNFQLDTTNYSEIVNQQYYLLKYFPAYFTEYFSAFEDFFDEYKKEKLNIVSVGCGAGIDFYALKSYIEYKGIDISINYNGIDIIDWAYKPNFNFIETDISGIDTNTFDNIDLIIFPKILTELNNATLKLLSKKIIESNLSDELYFINSYITNDSHGSNIDGKKQFEFICSKLYNNEYFVKKGKCDEHISFEEHHGIRADYNFFVYPDEIRQYIIKLKSNCLKVDNSKEICKNCNIGKSLKFVKNDN